MSGQKQLYTRAQSGFLPGRTDADDEYIVAQTRDPVFFALEPGLGAIVLGSVLEPHYRQRIAEWTVTLGAATGLISNKNPLIKRFALLMAFVTQIRAPGDMPVTKFIFALATLVRVLRVIDIYLDPEYFEERGWAFTVKFAFLYHDLRLSKKIPDEEARQAALKQCGTDILSSVGMLGGSMAALRLIRDYRNVKQLLPVFVFLSLFRFYGALNVVEIAYRAHLAYYGIEGQKCFDNPWASTTIAEFWSKRWNQCIARPIRNVCYKPAMAAGAPRRVGEFSVFAGSAALHAFPIFLMGGSDRAKISTLAYFVTQPVLLAIESYFKLNSVYWVQFSMWLTSPLFALPLLEVFPI